MEEIKSLEWVSVLVTEVQCSSIPFQNGIQNLTWIFFHKRGEFLKRN